MVKRHLVGAASALFVSLILFVSIAFAAADDYTVSGGDIAALPNVGATSLALNSVTLTDVGGDDFAASEDLVFAINTTDYPSVEFDDAVSSLSIGGTCGHDNAASISYDSSTQVTVTVDGAGGACAASSTITVDGLKLKTTYATSAPGSAKKLITVDNATTSSGSPVDGDTAQLAVGVGDLTSTNIEPEDLEVYEFSDHTVTFVTSAEISSGGKIVITYPSGFAVDAVLEGIENCSGIVCDNWTVSSSGQSVTLTENGTSATSAGTISFTLRDIRNPEDEGSAGTYTILTKNSSDASLETDAAVSSDTIVYYTEHAQDFTDPSEVAVADYEDGGVIITWEDPSDEGIKYINIYRGIDPYPVDGTEIKSVSIGTEYYIDDEVEDGDVVTYLLRSTDGLNSSDGVEITFTVGSDEEQTAEEDDTSDEESESADEGSDSDESTDGEEADQEDTDNESEGVSYEQGEALSFSDTEGHWAEEEISYMSSIGIIYGNDDGTFQPNENLNRAEGGILIYRLLTSEDPAEIDEDPFDDVDMDAWYAPYIAYLKEIGLITGNLDGTYEPGDNINRAEFVHAAMTIYERFNGEVETSEMTDTFVDLDTEEWYAQEVSDATAMGFIQGVEEEDGTYFYASRDITRAEAATVLYRMFGE